jgi:HSP20 family protein
MTTTETKPNGSTDVTRWQPGAEMFPWNTRLGHLIDAMWPSGWRVGEFPPSGDLEERDDMFVLEIDLPGVDKKNVTVNVADRRVSVHGTRVERERDGVLRHSTRVTGTFSYELALPIGGRGAGVGDPEGRRPDRHAAQGT